MKTSVEFELEPFVVPEFVNTKRDVYSGIDSPSLHLRSLSMETLEELCAQFRKNVFLKANKGKLIGENQFYHTK